MKTKTLIIFVACSIVFFFAISGLYADTKLGGGKSEGEIKREPGPDSLPGSGYIETVDANIGGSQSQQYPGSTPDAVPTIPAEIEDEEKKNTSRKLEKENWYEDKESSGVDVY